MPKKETQNPIPAPAFQRRGKVASLPRRIREELNTRLDDGQSAPQILPWLNSLPEVTSPITPQNLSLWRQGGFQEWLLQTDLLDRTAQTREQSHLIQEKVIGTARTTGQLDSGLADDLVVMITARFAALLVGWDGQPSDDFERRAALLLKISKFLLQLQKASHRATREVLELPKHQRQAKREALHDFESDPLQVQIEHRQNILMAQALFGNKPAAPAPAKAKKTPKKRKSNRDKSRYIQEKPGDILDQFIRPEDRQAINQQPLPPKREEPDYSKRVFVPPPRYVEPMHPAARFHPRLPDAPTPAASIPETAPNTSPTPGSGAAPNLNPG